MKKTMKWFAAVSMFLLLASAAHAYTTFDLNLSVLEPGESDLKDIYSVIFDGTPTLNINPDGTFSESGTGFLNLYRTAPDAAGQSLPVSGLTLSFTNLTGTYTIDSGITTIAFDPNQVIDLNYAGTTYARFSLGTASGGQVQQFAGGVVTTLNQFYYFQLIEDDQNLFDGPESFEAVLTASAFNGGNYLMVGEASAVPIPGSLLLIGSGLACLAGLRRRH